MRFAMTRDSNLLRNTAGHWQLVLPPSRNFSRLFAEASQNAKGARREQFGNHLAGNLQSVQQISAKLTGLGCLLRGGHRPLSGLGGSSKRWNFLSRRTAAS